MDQTMEISTPEVVDGERCSSDAHHAKKGNLGWIQILVRFQVRYGFCSFGPQLMIIAHQEMVTLVIIWRYPIQMGGILPVVVNGVVFDPDPDSIYRFWNLAHMIRPEYIYYSDTCLKN